MFSSGNNANNNNNNNNSYHHPLAVPFYQYTSSSPSTHPLISQDTDSNILYNYYQHPLLAGQQLLPSYVSPENTAAANMAAAVAALNSSSHAPGVAVTNAFPERPAKKDRHSKIYTAQGLRDRRVRLSTEIARQFFDLQDLLGYDKASETIAWLLNKSKKDIRELVEMKTKNFSSPSDSGMFPVNNHQGSEDGEPEGTVSQNNNSLTGTSKENKKMKSQRAAEFQLHRKDSRTTKSREKDIDKFHGLNQARSSIHHFEVGEKSGSLRGCAEFGGKSTDPITNNQFPREDIMEESIMIHRKLKPSSSSLGYQHNFSCLPQNWDMNGAATSASSCDATPTMNLSTELLMSGKAWEACNNQCLE